MLNVPTKKRWHRKPQGGRANSLQRRNGHGNVLEMPTVIPRPVAARNGSKEKVNRIYADDPI